MQAPLLSCAFLRPLAVGLFTMLGACTEPNAAYQGATPSPEPPGEAGTPGDTVARADAPTDRPVDSPAEAPADGLASGLVDTMADAQPADPPDASAGSMDTGGPDVTVSSAGLVLHWRFDEATGREARDSSPSGLHGAAEGTTPPFHDTAIPPTRFPNSGSRRFQVNLNHGVRLSESAAILRPTTGLTVSVWFRTTQTTRSDLVCNGADYFIRFMPPEVEFVRRRPPIGSVNFVTATGNAPNAFDGAWHHAAGVATPAFTAMYIDGVRVARDSSGIPFTYLSGSVNVGRNAAASLNFEGWLDDVRIYARALDEDEIRALAAGAP